jgi:stringent starvation protein B
MISKRPYLFRAMYDWILDNNLTPHIVVDTSVSGVSVPPSYVEDDKITLDLSPTAVTGFAMSNESLEFKASFGGRLLHLYIPMSAIIVIFAQENNHCLVFGASEINKGIIVNMNEEGEPSEDDGEGGSGSPPPKKGPPKLSIVK